MGFRMVVFRRSVKAMAALTICLLVVAGAPVLRAAPAVPSFASGDYIITQESAKARRQARDRTAGSFIFHLAQSGEIQVIARPPQITGPRGIRALGAGQFVVADAVGGAIRVMTAQSTIKTLHAGPPLTVPKDVAVDRGGGYVVADFDKFTATARASIFKMTDAGKITTVARGGPLRWPHGIDVDKDGNYIVADHSGAVFRVSPQAQVTTVVAGAPLIAATDVKVDRDGNYIVTDIGLVIDAETGRVVPEKSKNPSTLFKITPNGRVSVIAKRRRAQFRAVALRPDGGYVVVDTRNNALYRITPGGTITVIFEGPPLSYPADVAIVP